MCRLRPSSRDTTVSWSGRKAVSAVSAPNSRLLRVVEAITSITYEIICPLFGSGFSASWQYSHAFSSLVLMNCYFSSCFRPQCPSKTAASCRPVVFVLALQPARAYPPRPQHGFSYSANAGFVLCVCYISSTSPGLSCL